MSGRFSLTEDWSAIIQYFGIPDYNYAIPPRYNIAPSQSIPVVIADNSGKRRIGPMSWGLIPKLWHNEVPKVKPINARLEGLKTNGVFKRLVECKRCIIPASGYFEWRKTDKQPFHIRVKSRPVFGFAGFYDSWEGTSGQRITTCTIITCPPNFSMRPIHDRMPAILKTVDERFWLDRSVTNIDELLSVIEPYPENDMTAYQVSKVVGNVANDTPECVKELAQ